MDARAIWSNMSGGGRHLSFGGLRLRRYRLEGALRRRATRISLLVLLLASLILGLCLTAFNAHNVGAQPFGIRPNASCGELANRDRTATNGSGWGRTILPGHNASGGWFGVSVCANGINTVVANGSNVSCDRVPAQWAGSGCAPGSPTSDGYGWTFQCPELIVRFSAWAFGDLPGDWGRSGWGNAPDLWLPTNHPKDFIIYPNGSEHAPVPGDILVWGAVDAKGQPWPAGPDGEHGGHIAIVAGLRGGAIITAEQNVKWGSQDHPSDTLALTHVGTHWILSGSQERETKLPTYRWLRTMGHSRATYGWLHSVRNTGVFPSKTRGPVAPSKPSGTKPPADKQTPRQAPGGLPSLTSAVVVTGGGTLADLMWSTESFFAPGQSDGMARAHTRSLGAPSGVRLSVNQDPALVTLTDGTRYVYVVGVDGHLYEAKTDPYTLGVVWSDLAMPGSGPLAASPSATLYAGGIAVAAHARDGRLWWRAGPAGHFGDWQFIDLPSSVEMAGPFAFAGAPGVGSPLILALGRDGQIYERVWQNAVPSSDGSTLVPANWSEWIALHAQPSGVHLSGRLVIVTEPANGHDQVGGWPDTPLDVIALDTQGAIWWLRSTALQRGWEPRTIAAPKDQLATLLDGTMVALPTSGAGQAASTQAASPTPTASTPTPAPTQMPVPAPSTTADQDAAGALQLYTASRTATYLVTAPLQAVPAGGTPSQADWQALPALPGGVPVAVGGTALRLGPGTSALIAPAADSVVAGSVPDGLEALSPSATEATPDPHARWIALGAVPVASSFADTLRSAKLDPRWQLVGAGAMVAPSPAGVRLVPGLTKTSALLQLAPDGAVSVTVRVALPSGAGKDVQAGLVLLLDDADWVTLLADGGGQATLCATAWQTTTPCLSLKLANGAVQSGVWLRLDRRDASVGASASMDGIAWQPLGQWTIPISDSGPSAPPVADATTTPAATPTLTPNLTPTVTPSSTASAAAPRTMAPLGFSVWGLLVRGGPLTIKQAPLYSDFSYAAATGTEG